MSTLLNIQEKLQDTGAAIAEIEKAIVSGPQSPSIIAMRRSLEKRLRILEADFLQAASQAGIDVCSYRVFSADGSPRLSPLMSTFSDFQKLVSTVYSAIKKGEPKQRATFSADDAEESAFGFGYAFPGSVGFVLTISNERLLFGETHLDDSISTIFEMVKVTSPDEMHPFVQKLGTGPVRALYRWSNDHAKSGLGADIDWRRGRDVRARAFIQAVEFDALREVLDKSSEEHVEEIVLTGELVAASLPSKTFKMQFESGDDIHGKFEDAISASHKAELPTRYKASLTKTSRTNFALEEDEETYFLNHLIPA